MRNKIIGVFAGVLVVVLLLLSGNITEHVDAGEIVVIQGAIDGELHVTTEPGWAAQWFGTPTHYKRSFPFWFSKANDQGADTDHSIKVRFNDGGHAQVSGSVRINMPTDEKSVRQLHSDFGSQEAVEAALIRPMIDKVIYMTGPLMSSKESYAEKRTQLLNFIEDQASNGVYKTVTIDRKRKDELSGQEQTVSEVEILHINGIAQRQEVSPLRTYKIVLNPGTLSLNAIDYDATVEGQIKQQQTASMSVQTAMANSKKAEQDAITVAKQGEALAAKAKWDQEILKATAVTQAEQNLAVQKLATQQAQLYKEQQILEGQGDAEKKRLIMSADGAIDQKLEAWKFERAKAWENFGKFTGNLVPLYQTGGVSGGSNAMNYMELMGLNAAKQLGLDMSMPKGGNK